VPSPSLIELAALADAAPPMLGGEYLSADVLAALWWDMDCAFDAELADATLPVQEFLKRRNPARNDAATFSRSATALRRPPFSTVAMMRLRRSSDKGWAMRAGLLCQTSA
jgi:hypothetical protein